MIIYVKKKICENTWSLPSFIYGTLKSLLSIKRYKYFFKISVLHPMFNFKKYLIEITYSELFQLNNTVVWCNNV